MLSKVVAECLTGTQLRDDEPRLTQYRQRLHQLHQHPGKRVPSNTLLLLFRFECCGALFECCQALFFLLSKRQLFSVEQKGVTKGNSLNLPP